MSHQNSLCRSFVCCLGAAVATTACLLSGCGGGDDESQQGTSKYEIKDESTPTTAISSTDGGAGGQTTAPRTGASTAQPRAIAGSQFNYAPPANGDLQALLAHMQKLTQLMPRGATPEEQMADILSIQRARIATADKILAASPDAESRQAAIEHKLHALRQLEAQNEPGATGQIKLLAASLVASSDPNLSLLGKMVQFGQQFDAFEQSGSKDASLIMQQLNALLAEPNRSAYVFDLAHDTAQRLGQLGFKQEMLATIKSLSEAYKDHPDEQLAADAASLGKQLKVVEYGSRHGLDTAMLALAEKKPGAEKEVVAAVQNILAAEEKDDVLMEMSQTVATELRSAGFKDESRQLMKSIGQTFGGSADPQLAEAASQISTQVGILEMGFESKLQKLVDKDPAAPAELVALMQQILAAGLNENVVMDVGQAVGNALGETNHPAEKVQVLRMLGQTYQNSANKDIVHAAGELQTQARIIEYGLDENLKKLLLGEPDAASKVVASVDAILRGEQPGESVLQSVSQAAEYLEMANDFAAEGQVLNMIEAVYSKHPEADFVETAKLVVDNGRRRMALVGKPVSFAVETLDGKPIDWNSYRGKVLLIDFWATWCNPCIAEFPNIERNYKAYRARGFEVVGINVNESRGELDAFLAVGNIPWTLAVAQRREGLDHMKATNELTQTWGIGPLPFTVLVNQEGIVEALHVRGSDLDKQLERILGPAGSSPIGAVTPKLPATTPGAPATTDGAALQSRPDVGESLDDAPVYFTALIAEDEETAEEGDDEPKEVNPYLAPANLTDLKLVEYLLDMADRPMIIQERPGFAEAVIDASDRLLAMDTKPNYKRLAVLSKLRALHRMAYSGNAKADEQLVKFVDSLKDNADEKVAVELNFLRLEREALDCEKLDVEKIPDLLARLKTFFESEKRLEEQHLRIASATVKAINRLENDDEREKHFAEFGKLFAASKNQQLSIYGQKLARPVAEVESDLVGKDLELVGLTALGAEFNWKAYRGKVVIVDFWATWCGPCIREMPHVKEFHAAKKDKGFDVVGVSLDKDQEALAKFLEENDVPWETLAGEGTQKLAEKYGVRAIPTMMLVDREGKVVAVSHQIAALKEKAEKLLEKAAE